MANGWSVVAEVVTSCAAFGAVWVASMGLDEWKRQKKWETEHELMRSIMRASRSHLSSVAKAHDIAAKSPIFLRMMEDGSFGDELISQLEDRMRDGLAELRRTAADLFSLCDEATFLTRKDVNGWGHPISNLTEILEYALQNCITLLRPNQVTEIKGNLVQALIDGGYMVDEKTPITIHQTRIMLDEYKILFSGFSRKLRDLVD